MKIYLILLLISGLSYFYTLLLNRIIIKKYDYQRIRKPFIEEVILADIQILITWALIIIYPLAVIGSMFFYEAYEEGVCNGLENSEMWE